LVTGIHSFSARWRNHFSQIFNVYGFSDVRHTEIHTADIFNVHGFSDVR